MGRYDKDLAFIAQLLGAGLPFDQAYTMYDTAGLERDTRQAERKANLQSLMQSGVEGAIAGYDQDANTAMLSALAQGMGLGEKALTQAGAGLGGLYDDGGQSVFEEDWGPQDEELVLGLVEQLKTAEGADTPDARARAREVISEYVRKAVGEEDYAKIRSQMHATIDRAWGVPAGMSLQDMAAQATGEAPTGSSSTGDPDDNIGWIPDFIEGPANFLTFGGVDNLANAENWGDVGQGLAGIAGGALGVGGLRALSAVPKIGKAASFLGGLGTKPVAAATRNIPYVGPKIANAAGGLSDVAKAATTTKRGYASMFDDVFGKNVMGATPSYAGGVTGAAQAAPSAAASAAPYVGYGKYTSAVEDIINGMRGGSPAAPRTTDDILRWFEEIYGGL